MAAKTQVLIQFNEQDYERFDFEFRILCALNRQTVGERFTKLMKHDLELNSDFFEEQWVGQPDLLDALEAAGKSISRQKLRTHRRNGTLPAEYFVESKIESDSPTAAKNQRTYYKKQKCLEFYGALSDSIANS